MNDTNGAMDRFLAFAMLKGQLEEIHHAIEMDVLSRAVLEKKERLEIPPGETKEISFKLHITNAGKDTRQGMRLVVEELTRLKTLVDSIGDTISYMRDVAQSNGIPEPKQ